MGDEEKPDARFVERVGMKKALERIVTILLQELV
jgi:hypothetical protein